MASLIDELIGILQKEYSIYQELIPIAETKTQVIVKNDLVSLQEITDKEQKAVDAISFLEHNRKTVMENIKTVINRRTNDFNLKDLIGLLEKQPKEQRALSVLHDNLRYVIHRLSEINSRNSSLIQQALEMIEFDMNLIQSTRMSPGNNTYTKSASRYDAQLRGTGMFDAIQ